MIRQRPYTPAGKLQRAGAAKPTAGKDRSQVLWERVVGITAAVALFLCATLSLSVRYSRMPELTQARASHTNNNGSSKTAANPRPAAAAQLNAASINTAPLQPQQHLAQLRKAASRPINVLLMHKVPWHVVNPRNCSVEGIPLDCRFSQQASQAALNTADVLYYHSQQVKGPPERKAFPEQLRLVVGVGSAVLHKELDDPSFMCQFDAEMSYRRCAQVVTWHRPSAIGSLFKAAVVPFEAKTHAVAYISNNCSVSSGRNDIMRALLAVAAKSAAGGSKLQIHSMGKCENNKAWPEKQSQQQVMSRFKFCVAIEDSIAQDYVTDILWEALAAGCVPIYYGSRSILQYVPDPHSVVVYDPGGSGNASSPQQLYALLQDIGSSRERYEGKLAWQKRKPADQPSPLFRYLWSISEQSAECLLCQFVARHRAAPQPRYTTCLFNSSWMAAAGRQAAVDTCADGERQALAKLQQQKHGIAGRRGLNP